MNRTHATLAAARSALALALAFAASLAGGDARAGCGCTKPPPAPAAVRPAVAWSGAEVALFAPSLVPGRHYVVYFESGVGPDWKLLGATAVARRDLADGVVKPQLVVPLPSLPLGPAGITVFTMSSQLVLAVPDTDFTVAPQPIGIPTGVGTYRFEGHRAAVSRAGVVYLALDFGDVQHARVFAARAEGLPLRFGSSDVAFWNVQGFLMQLLGEDMPGLFAIASTSGADSDVLHYSRHEFNTWFLQHEERADHAVDPSDPSWHLDGTPHIDHDHQLLEIAGTLDGGAMPAPGATPPFTLVVETSTLFHHGVVGRDAILVDNQAVVRSQDFETGELGHEGHVWSNGVVAVKNQSVVDGDAVAASFQVTSGGVITGALGTPNPPASFLPVDAPPGLIDLGDWTLATTTTLGVGSYRAESLEVVSGGRLEIDNDDGPVTIYVSGDVVLQNGGVIATASTDPENFAIYLIGEATAKFSDGSGFFGVVYGPEAVVEVDNGGVFGGAFVGADVRVKSSAQVLYDARLHRNVCSASPPPLAVPADLVLEPGKDISIPLDLALLLGGYRLRIGDETRPLGILDGGLLGVEAPADLLPGSRVELTLVDAQGCRSWRTVMVEVEGDASACGLLGIEPFLAVPLARLALRRARRRRPRA